MWHEARKQERRIRGLIVDYRKRAERRQDFYEKIQADPTQFIQVHGRRCKIHLDPAVAAAGDGAAIIVPWQGQQDNLIDRFDVRSILDYIPPVPKSTDAEAEELTIEERQCNYERYRILAQNDFLNMPEEKFLHQLYLEEQYGVNAQLEAERSLGKKKQPPKSGATIGYSYDDNELGVGPQPYSHLLSNEKHMKSKSDNGSESDSDSDMDMDVSIDISKLDTTQAHELNACGRSYGMLGNDFFSYLTKDIDDADALRIAREEEQEKMLLSGRKSRRERRAQKERRIASRPFSPPSYAAKEEAAAQKKKDEESDSRSPSPSDGNAGKITYITSFGGEDELQPHSKITFSVGGKAVGQLHTLGESCAKATASAGSTLTYAQKVKENLEKMKAIGRNRKHSRQRDRKSRSRSRSRDNKRRSHRHKRRAHSRSWSRSRGRSLSRSRYHKGCPRSISPERSSRRRRRNHKSRSHSRRKYQRSRSSSSSSSSSSRSTNRYSRTRSRSRSRLRQRGSRRDKKSHSPKYKIGTTYRSSSILRSKTRSPIKTNISSDTQLSKMQTTQAAARIKTAITAIPAVACSASSMLDAVIAHLPALAAAPPPPPPLTVTAPITRVEEPPPPLKRYYGRKRNDEDSSSTASSDTEPNAEKEHKPFSVAADDANESDERLDVDTT